MQYLGQEQQQQQPLEIREMSKDLETYFYGLSRSLRIPDTLIQYLAIGYYYKKLPRYSMLDYLRKCLGSSWLETAKDIAQLVSEGKTFIAYDGPKDVIIPYSVLAEEILMILEIIQAYEQNEGVTIDEIRTVSQFDSYYSNFTKFISQYTTQATGLRTRASFSPQAVVNKFIELGLINDSYQQQKTPQKRVISMEDDTSEESVEELDVNENGEPVQKPLVEKLAGEVKKVIKKGKKSKHTRTIDKREVKKEEKQKQLSVREKKEIERKKREIETITGDYIFDRTTKGLKMEQEATRQETHYQKTFKELYEIVKNLKPILDDLKPTPSIEVLKIKEEDFEDIEKRHDGTGERVLVGKLSEETLQPFGDTGYKIAWVTLQDGKIYAVLKTNLTTYSGDQDLYYVIARKIYEKELPEKKLPEN